MLILPTNITSIALPTNWSTVLHETQSAFRSLQLKITILSSLLICYSIIYSPSLSSTISLVGSVLCLGISLLPFVMNSTLICFSLPCATLVWFHLMDSFKNAWDCTIIDYRWPYHGKLRPTIHVYTKPLFFFPSYMASPGKKKITFPSNWILKPFVFAGNSSTKLSAVPVDIVHTSTLAGKSQTMSLPTILLCAWFQ